LTLTLLINFAADWYYDASNPHRSGYCCCTHPFYELHARGNFDHLNRVSSILVWPQGGARKHHHFPALRLYSCVGCDRLFDAAERSADAGKDCHQTTVKISAPVRSIPAVEFQLTRIAA